MSSPYFRTKPEVIIRLAWRVVKQILFPDSLGHLTREVGKISTYIQYLAEHALTRGGGRKNTAKKKKNQSASSTNWRSLHPSSCNEVCPLRVNKASTKLWADSKRLKPTAATVHLPLLSCIPTCSMELYEEFFGYVDHTVHEVLSVHAFDDDEEWRRSTYNWRRISIRKEELLYSCIVMRWDNSKKKLQH